MFHGQAIYRIETSAGLDETLGATASARDVIRVKWLVDRGEWSRDSRRDPRVMYLKAREVHAALFYPVWGKG